MKYKNVEYYKNLGFIDENLNPDKQLQLSELLHFGNDVIRGKIFLSQYSSDDSSKFYSDVKHMLFPIIVHYTINKQSLNVFKIIGDFILFCENNLRIKYFPSEYNYDYLLCSEFIELNP